MIAVAPPPPLPPPKGDFFGYYFQISSNHVLLHQNVLDLLIRLFESMYEDLDVMVQVNLFKTLVAP